MAVSCDHCNRALKVCREGNDTKTGEGGRYGSCLVLYEQGVTLTADCVLCSRCTTQLRSEQAQAASEATERFLSPREAAS